jgi:hypothetical protein
VEKPTQKNTCLKVLRDVRRGQATKGSQKV